MPLGLNVVDWLLLATVLLATVRGCMRGLRSVAIEFVALLGGLFAALRLSPAVAGELGSALPLPAGLENGLALAATGGIVYAGLLLLGRLVLAPRLRLPMPSLPGALAGCVVGVALAALLAALLLSMPLPARAELLVVESRLATRIAGPALGIATALMPR